MGQVLHKCARTTQSVRKDIQLSKESIGALAEKYGVNPKTIVKWKKRDFTEDAPLGSKTRQTTITEAEEKVIVEFRRVTQFPLDDCLYTLQEIIPYLSRGALYRCFKRYGINKREEIEEEKREKKKFKEYEIGYFHIDICKVQTEQGVLYMFVAIDRTSKFAFAKLYERMTQKEAELFLLELLEFVPYKIHKILTDNGIQFTNRSDLETLFEKLCVENEIEHRKTQVRSPWTNGQVERMNRTLKDATVKTFYYETHEQLSKHLQDYLEAYNYGKRLKSLNGKTPWQFILERLKLKPHLAYQHAAKLDM